MTRSIARGIARLLERRGLAPDADPEEIDPLARDEPLLAALYSTSVRGGIPTGPRAGQAVLRVDDRIDVEQLPASGSQRCASIGGVSLHANVAVPARDRLRSELVSYVLTVEDPKRFTISGTIGPYLGLRPRQSHPQPLSQRLMTSLPRACPVPKYRIASGTSLSS